MDPAMPAGPQATPQPHRERPVTRARALGPDELRMLLAHISRHRHALRNATQVLLTYWAGLRVGEVAALRYADVVDERRFVRTELRVPQGEGRPPRMVPIPARLRRQLAIYLNAYPPGSDLQPLFYTQKRPGWSANTLAQHFFHLYRAAGLRGASSHSGRRTYADALARRSVRAARVARTAGDESDPPHRIADGQMDQLRISVD